MDSICIKSPMIAADIISLKLPPKIKAKLPAARAEKVNVTGTEYLSPDSIFFREL